MPGILSDPGVLRGRGTLIPRGAISQSRILTRPDNEWTPLDAHPILLLDPALGALKTGGTPAGYLDSIATWQNQGSGASAATHSTESHQPLYLPHDGENYLHLPGVVNGCATISNLISLNTFQFQITLKLRRKTWSGAEPSAPPILSRWNTINGQRAWNVSFTSGGVITMLVSSDGNSGGSVATRSSTTGVPFADGTWGWIRITGDSNVKFETSPDGITWTQLGSLLSPFPSAHHPANVNFAIGAYSNGNAPVANTSVGYVKIINSSSTALEIDFSKAPNATSFVCTTGQTVYVNSYSGITIVGHPSLRFDGSNDSLRGTFSDILEKGRLFVVGGFRSIQAGGRIFATASESGTDEDDTGAVWFYQAGADQPAVYFADSYQMVRSPGYHGRYVWETYLKGTSNLSRFNGGQSTSSASSETLASTRYSIAEALGEDPLNGAGDIEYLALFPATMSDQNVARMRAYLTHRFGLPT